METNYRPYVKKYENGILTNTITKEKPYLFAKVKISKNFKIWQTVKNKYFKGKTIVKI